MARWQPSGYRFPELPFLEARGGNGAPIKLSQFEAPISGYVTAYREWIRFNRAAVDRFVADLSPSHEPEIALLCWCPYARHSVRQIARHGTFFCHLALLRSMLAGMRDDLVVLEDKDRKNSSWATTERWWE